MLSTDELLTPAPGHSEAAPPATAVSRVLTEAVSVSRREAALVDSCGTLIGVARTGLVWRLSASEAHSRCLSATATSLASFLASAASLMTACSDHPTNLLSARICWICTDSPREFSLSLRSISLATSFCLMHCASPSLHCTSWCSSWDRRSSLCTQLWHLSPPLRLSMTARSWSLSCTVTLPALCASSRALRSSASSRDWSAWWAHRISARSFSHSDFSASRALTLLLSWAASCAPPSACCCC
mmetsp:Transcript_22531/g.54872  ORF Transcript_22531/g.54872 Transcript_22531/m.54872 type:complete len:243 (-) Transcript_22531:1192-1920(-)